ncbi:hypothetical protein [Kiritimatiella glycovorans]|uniref:hypothetical protein n=1 Tax=Kiritimatiella glycovorans TaxID=1307763 RepID=UPI0011873563|nr:hypothetical protein [Kiritimatiella glycovorans]
MIKLSPKSWCLIIICVFGGAVLVTTILNMHVYKRPEIEYCKAFLNKQKNIFPTSIGSVKSVDYRKQAAAKVSFRKDGIQGFYCFDVSGDTGEIRVRVHWNNTKNNDDFRVVRVEQIRGSDYPFQIWP